ncbi:transcription factor, contains a PHD finger motif [Rhinocladiella similis]
MDESSGRGHREKKPSEKVKEQVSSKIERVEDEDKSIVLPTYIAPNDPKFFQDQKEVPKIYDHTKRAADGERIDFYSLGTHVESKEKRYYVRAKRDPDTFYFHADEAPPRYARLSDENHPQCGVESLKNVFTKDMLGKSGEFGSYTTRANVFAREGKFFFEAKVLSIAPPGREEPDRALADSQNSDRTATNRGGLRVGFCRREHHWSENLGGNAYSYGVVLRSGRAREYGSVRFNTLMYHMQGEGGKDPEDLSPGDVVGLMITLPSLDVHKKVVEGTYNPAEYPDLKCGPANTKKKPGQGKKSAKSGTKPKDGEFVKTKDESSKKSTSRNSIRATLHPLYGLTMPSDHDIIRDRNPFLHKGMTYFECPEYTPNNDLSRPTLNSKNKSVNPETGKKYDLLTDPHPNTELPHLRTLPGSKIELWVNGKYHGVVWEHLFAFLPPASSIEKGSRAVTGQGDVDDGLLGYYPAISHYTGGAIECKFDGPWWYGFGQDGPQHPDARPIGERYQEQIVEDMVNDLVDEVYQERLYHDADWMKKKVLNAAAVNVQHN